MIADAFVIRLPDGTLHYARPGHVNALCGANRVTNADHWTGTVDAICPACSLLRGEVVHDADYHERVEAETGESCQHPDCLAAEARDDRTVDCPDCSTPWPIFSGEPCPGCGLAEEDVEAAADFWIALSPGPL